MVKRCTNGHYFDGDRFPTCPYCGSDDMNESSGVTVSLGGSGKTFQEANSGDDDMRTIKLEQAADYQTQANYIDDDDATIPIAPPSMVQQPAQPPVQLPEQPVQSFEENAFANANVPSETPDYAPQAEFAPPAEQPVPQQQAQFMPSPVPTVPMNNMQGGLGELVSNAMKNPTQVEDSPTVSIYGSRMKSEPTVGWLIGLSGPYLGECFELRTGKNFIGRGQDMDVVLAADNTVSRYRHAVVLYEPKARIFLAQPGESRELFYINDNVVLNNQPLEAYDRLTIGDTKLMFFPLCSSEFSWDDVQKDD